MKLGYSYWSSRDGIVWQHQIVVNVATPPETWFQCEAHKCDGKCGTPINV